MRVCRLLIVLLMSLLMNFGTLLRAETELPEVGDTAVARADSNLKLSGKVVGQVKANEVLTIHAVRGVWVNVGSDAKPGWIKLDQLWLGDEAAAKLDENLAQSPTAAGYLARAGVWISQRRYSKAAADLKKAAALDANLPEIYELRTQIALAEEEYLEALEHISRAIELQGKSVKYHRQRLEILHKLPDRFLDQVKELQQLAELDALQAMEYNNLAWWLATAANGTGIQRDGKLAIQYAEKACELTNHEDYKTLDTLAAAYAENGDFANATTWQQQAIDACDIAYQKRDCERRLKLYQNKQPYRESPSESLR